MQEIAKLGALCATHLVAVDSALSPGRIDRYLVAAGNDRTLALRYYMWNSELCQSFYVPIQMAEIAVRNCILKALVARYGTNWPFETGCTTTLSDRCRAELAQAIADERQEHGAACTHEHIASAVSFSFWDHLCTKRFRPLLWAKGITPFLPHFPDNTDLPKLQVRIMTIRQWRNRLAHYKTVFDKNPTQKHNDILELLSWISPDLRTFVRDTSRFSRVLGRRPT